MKLIKLIDEILSILPFLSVQHVACIIKEGFEAVLDLIDHFDCEVLHDVYPIVVFLLNFVYSYQFLGDVTVNRCFFYYILLTCETFY